METQDSKARMAQIIQGPFEYTQCPSDVWGVTMIIVLKDLADMWAGKARAVHIARFTFGVCALGANLVFQVTILMWVETYIVSVSVRNMQENYFEYHKSAFGSDGEFDPAKWDEFNLRAELCATALSQFPFLFFISFLWGARMLMELRAVHRLIRILSDLPELPSEINPEEMVQERTVDGKEHYEIVCLNQFSKVSLYIFVIIPKMIIAGFLLWIGLRWLTSTDNFGDLILNALALQFVINIDELFFMSFFPVREHHNVHRTRWALPAPMNAPALQNRRTLAAYWRSAFFVVFVFVVVYVYLVFGQRVLPGFEWDITHCNKFIADFLSPACDHVLGECFPYGKEPDRIK